MTGSSTFLAADGDGYELQMGRWSRRLARPFLEFVGTANGERVLDVGCGTGRLAFALTEQCQVKELLGIDCSPAYIAHATRHNHDPRIVFQVGDACALDFPDHRFDRVLSLLMLHFVPRADQAIAEMRRVARLGSMVGAAVWDTRGGFVANRIFFDTAAVLDPKADERRARAYARPLTRPGELANAWRAAGFREVVETALSICMEFASFEDYWAPYAGQDGPGAEYIATLSEAERTRLREAVRCAYVDGEPDGPRSYVAVAWAVRDSARLTSRRRRHVPWIEATPVARMRSCCETVDMPQVLGDKTTNGWYWSKSDLRSAMKIDAQPPPATDCRQRALRSRFRQQLTPGVRRMSRALVSLG